MSGNVFIDTNVFLYHLDDSDAAKHVRACELIREALINKIGCISYQVIQECLNAGLRKAHIPLDHEMARRYLKTVLLPLWRIMPSHDLFRRGIDVQQRYGFHFYDSLIVAAALEADCTILFTEDLQHGQSIERRLTIENPFLSV